MNGPARLTKEFLRKMENQTAANGVYFNRR